MQASGFSYNISRRCNEDIENLRTAVLTTGGAVESRLARVVFAGRQHVTLMMEDSRSTERVINVTWTARSPATDAGDRK